ncbi:MAG: hypothetical protein LBC19_16630, partial [Tannerella sp.]|nr:hypothetical protein [Tannerella sp.]
LLLFSGCKDDTLGIGYLVLEKRELLLKSDATPYEVGVKGGWWIESVEIDGEQYKNTLREIAGPTSGINIPHDTLTADWIEVYRLDNGKKIKVAPQPNTTGAERSALIVLNGGNVMAGLTVIQPAK